VGRCGAWHVLGLEVGSVLEDLPRRTLFALLSGDMAGFAELAGQLDKETDVVTNHLLGAVFYLAARRRWEPGEAPEGVAEFAAELREEMEVEPGEVAPADVEALVVAAVTGETEGMARIEPAALINLETLAAYKLVSEFRLEVGELDALLSEAERLAAEWAR
jgi:hypothetical protein